jgi:hypothetical protein
MPSGIWLIVIIPAIVAFLFGVYVTFNMLDDVSNRGETSTLVDPLQGVYQGGPPPGAK